MTTDIAVEMRELTKDFGAFRAVDAVSLSVNRGEVFGFLGANGAGKTTVIRMLCGLLKPSAGTARVGGFDIAREARSVKASIGYMSQKFSLYEDLTVRNNIEFYGGVYGLTRSQLREKTQALLAELRLEEHADRVTNSLPLGWKQRLALGTALLHDPRILFLDEPTGGVDPISRRNFWRLIYELAAKGTTVFVTTHYMDEAEYCSRLSIMHGGRLIALGTPGELKRAHGFDSMQDVFMKLVRDETARATAAREE